MTIDEDAERAFDLKVRDGRLICNGVDLCAYERGTPLRFPGDGTIQVGNETFPIPPAPSR